jgi:hypothetical protein
MWQVLLYGLVQVRAGLALAFDHVPRNPKVRVPPGVTVPLKFALRNVVVVPLLLKLLSQD